MKLRRFIEAVRERWDRFWVNTRTGEVIAVESGTEHDNYVHDHPERFGEDVPLHDIEDDTERDASLNRIYARGWNAVLYAPARGELNVRANTLLDLRRIISNVSDQVPIRALHADVGPKHITLDQVQLRRFVRSGRLTEAKEQLNFGGEGYEVLFNPSPNELVGALNRYTEQYGRGLMLYDTAERESLIVWPGYEVTHDSMAEIVQAEWGMGENGKFEFYPVQSDEIEARLNRARYGWTRLGPVWVRGPVSMLKQTPLRALVNESIPKGWESPGAAEITQVYTDPSAQQLLGAFQRGHTQALRGIITNGRSYWWNAFEAIHSEGVGQLEQQGYDINRSNLTWLVAALDLEAARAADTINPELVMEQFGPVWIAAQRVGYKPPMRLALDLGAEPFEYMLRGLKRLASGS
jgi:hypothetical protein